MATCAVVQISDGLVINKIVAEPTDLAPEGCELVDITDTPVEIGWFWDGSSFTNPNQV